jgi:hypothetical protein
VAERSGVDPAVLDAVSARGQGWYVEGAVQERGAASFLSRTDAVALVRDAAEAYLRARAG